LHELQMAQASLVHAQKMAALGQVTAGIAHEIKNPLNFVNNFAGLSVELLEELKGTASAVATLDPGKRDEIVETISMLTGNLEKIVEHGHRADGPYGFAAESQPYDERIVQLVTDNQLGELVAADPGWALAAKADSFWQLLMLHGAIGEAFHPELLSYEVPTYFGMLCASFAPRQD